MISHPRASWPFYFSFLYYVRKPGAVQSMGSQTKTKNKLLYKVKFYLPICFLAFKVLLMCLCFFFFFFFFLSQALSSWGHAFISTLILVGSWFEQRKTVEFIIHILNKNLSPPFLFSSRSEYKISFLAWICGPKTFQLQVVGYYLCFLSDMEQREPHLPCCTLLLAVLHKPFLPWNFLWNSLPWKQFLCLRHLPWLLQRYKQNLDPMHLLDASKNTSFYIFTSSKWQVLL